MTGEARPEGDRAPTREPMPPTGGGSYVHTPQLGRGLVWSDLVEEMEQDWARRRHERAAEGPTGIDLPLHCSVVRRTPDERGEAA